MARLELFTMRVTPDELARMRKLARYRRETISVMIRALLDTEEGRQLFNEATTPEAQARWEEEEGLR